MPDANSPDEIAARFNVSRESSLQLGAYADLLLKWQKRINLIGPGTVNEVWPRHIADALQLGALIPASAKVIVDLGSGAGIPGLVLAIAYGRARGFSMHLVESNGKKAAFLREAVRITGAPAVVHQCRAETVLSGDDRIPADIVLARALAPLPALLDLTHNCIAVGAVGLFHKGQDVDIELTEATKYWNIAVRKHTSVIDSRSCILEIMEIRRVACF